MRPGHRSRIRVVVIIVALLVAFLTAPVRAHAYDFDTHYLWTYYLALHAGFTDRQAFQIASGTQSIDVDPDVNPLFLATPEAIIAHGSPGHAASIRRAADPRNDPVDRLVALRDVFDFSGDNLTAILGPESPFGNPAMGRVWRNYHCFVERALQDKYQRAARGERVVFTWDDLLGLATQAQGPAVEARERQGDALWAQAVADGNPGPFLHFRQDCHSHGDFTDLRGHAVFGHAPDWWSVQKMHAWAMTEETLTALRDFRRQYLREPTNAPDMARIRTVFQRMIDANPSANLGIIQGGDTWLAEAHATREGRFYNFWSPVAATLSGNVGFDFALPDMTKAFLVIMEAIEEDRAAGRLHPFPEVYWQTPPDNFLLYDYDGNAQVHMDLEEFVGGTSYTRARSRSGDETGNVDAFRVEQPEVEMLDDSSQYPRVRIRPDRSSRGLYTVDVALTYEVSNLGHFGAGLPVYEECKWSDFFEVWSPPPKDRTNGTWQVRSKVFRTYEKLKDGVSWTCTVHPYGYEPKEVTVDVRWSGPPPEEEEREPGASEDLVRLWEALLDTRGRAIGTKAQVESTCASVAAVREAVGAEIREYNRSLGPMEREVKALERVGAVVPTARETIDGHAQTAYQSAEQASESRSRVGESALETCETAERIRVTEDIPELTRLMERASEAHDATKGWRDNTLEQVAAAEAAAKQATALKDEIFGFEAELAQVRDYLGRALPALARARGQVESATPLLEGARPQVAVFASLEEEATGILQEAEGMLDEAPSKENKRVVRRMRGLHREVTSLFRTGGACLDQEQAKLNTLAPKVAALETSTNALNPRTERLASISLDFDTREFIAVAAGEAEASFAAADLFPDSVREMTDQSAICLGVGRDVVKERTNPQAQVADYDCSMFANAEARWNRGKREPSCYCPTNYMWNEQGTGCVPMPPPGGDPSDPNRQSCQHQAFLIQQFRSFPEDIYQQMAQQTADQAIAMGCAPALITAANGGAAGGQGGTTSGSGSTTSGGAGSAFRLCEWLEGGMGTWGSGEGTGEYYCSCTIHYPNSTWEVVDPQGDWE
ncbi:MAG: hypothetical protein JRI25_19320, partial [Deltaproteobacteria bacterium]|nr:hypothetical protein [Deltaproteobacteria bacterium]